MFEKLRYEMIVRLLKGSKSQIMANVKVEGPVQLDYHSPCFVTGCTFTSQPVTVREAWRQLKGAVLDSLKRRLH